MPANDFGEDAANTAVPAARSYRSDTAAARRRS